MKRFRVREIFTVTGWTYIDAENISEAEIKLTSECGEFERTGELDIYETDWETLEEVKKGDTP